MSHETRIEQLFAEHLEVMESARQTLPRRIAEAGERIAQSVISGGKVLACGNGGSAADAQHFAAELVGRFECERRALAAVALTTDTSALTALGNDYGFERIFSRQVEALGCVGDWLLAISTSGNSANVLAAVETAHAQNMPIVALTGRDGGAMAQALADGDIELRVPSDSTARTQEVHILILHSLCDLIEQAAHD